jgi:hypothetical protein
MYRLGTCLVSTPASYSLLYLLCRASVRNTLFHSRCLLLFGLLTLAATIGKARIPSEVMAYWLLSRRPPRAMLPALKNLAAATSRIAGM